MTFRNKRSHDESSVPALWDSNDNSPSTKQQHERQNASTRDHRRAGNLIVATSTPRALVTMRDQLMGLAMGTHPRFFFLQLSIVYPGSYDETVVMITFGVCSVLMTLTHEMRWWFQRGGEKLLGANQRYLVVRKNSRPPPSSTSGWWLMAYYYLQDTVTGKRKRLVDGTLKLWGLRIKCRTCGDSGTNGKWLVHCEPFKKELVLVEIPKWNLDGATTCTPTATCVSFGSIIKDRGMKYTLSFCRHTEDHVLLSCCDFRSRFCELILVDLFQSRERNQLVVLSSTRPDVDHFNGTDLMPWNFFSPLDTHLIIPKQDGSNIFLPCPDLDTFPVTRIAEGTGTMSLIQEEACNGELSQLNQSQFCVRHGAHYDVWDVNEPTKPLRSEELNSADTTRPAFVDGGLLFQTSSNSQHLRVTEESTGSHVLTLKFSRCLQRVIHHFSFLL
ncbi:hypothetical protein Pelo_17520 [Pelomyxa schiedti]|nr:hypothetical protein Pelo_17520 [Pelomyxa schiedti]